MIDNTRRRVAVDRETMAMRAQERRPTTREREKERWSLEGFLALSKDEVRALLMCLQTTNNSKKKEILEDETALSFLFR